MLVWSAVAPCIALTPVDQAQHLPKFHLEEESGGRGGARGKRGGEGRAPVIARGPLCVGTQHNLGQGGTNIRYNR